jgi:hypothetical protein
MFHVGRPPLRDDYGVYFQLVEPELKYVVRLVTGFISPGGFTDITHDIHHFSLDRGETRRMIAYIR